MVLEFSAMGGYLILKVACYLAAQMVHENHGLFGWGLGLRHGVGFRAQVFSDRKRIEIFEEMAVVHLANGQPRLDERFCNVLLYTEMNDNGNQKYRYIKAIGNLWVVSNTDRRKRLLTSYGRVGDGSCA